MNKYFQKLLLLTVPASLLLSAWAITPANFDKDKTLDSQITVSSKLKDISQADIEAVKKEVQVALGSIPQILGIESRKVPLIKIDETDICFAIDGVVSLSISHIRDSSAPIIHEVTHILAKHKYNSFFSEGLAVYFQERFGTNNGFPNFSESLDDLVRDHQDRLFRLSHLMYNNNIFEQIGTEQRRLAYIEAGSFINFLVEKYGEQKLADLHNSWTLDYKTVYGKHLIELEDEWKNYILGSLYIAGMY